MITRYEFEKMLKDFNMTSPMQKDMASAIWLRCEQAMQGKTNQEPVLLKAKTFKCSENEFTREELQFMKVLFARILTAGDMSKGLLKRQIDLAWDYSDPEDKNSEEVFKHMNHLKDQLRKAKKGFDKIADLQKKVKSKLSRYGGRYV